MSDSTVSPDCSEWISCRRRAPFRPVDWRWRLARLLRERNIWPQWCRKDRWLARALRFQKDWEAARSETRLDDLAHAMPDIFTAHQFWLRKDEPVGWELEARLLTDDSFEAIAARFAAQPRAIKAYEAIFYHVKDRIDADCYIRHFAIGRRAFFFGIGLAPYHADVLAKLFAYYYGTLGLDYFLQLNRNGETIQVTFDDPETILSAETRKFMRLKGVISAMTVPVTEETMIPLIRLNHELQWNEAKMGTAVNGGEPDISPNVEAMFRYLNRQMNGPGSYVGRASSPPAESGGESAEAPPCPPGQEERLAFIPKTYPRCDPA